MVSQQTWDSFCRFLAFFFIEDSKFTEFSCDFYWTQMWFNQDYKTPRWVVIEVLQVLYIFVHINYTVGASWLRERWSRKAPGRQHWLDWSFPSKIRLLSLMSSAMLVAIKLCSTVLPCIASKSTLLPLIIALCVPICVHVCLRLCCHHCNLKGSECTFAYLWSLIWFLLRISISVLSTFSPPHL